MSTISEHISVCVCTFNRPKLLIRLLNALKDQKTSHLFTYSVIVVDNDQQMSAKNSLINFKRDNPIDISYFVEPQQNISLARNKTIEKSKGNYIAIIDDDEFPPKDWLFKLYTSLIKLDADGILGPVKAFYEKEPPAWVVKGNFYNKNPNMQTGQVLKWHETRTSNALIRKNIIDFRDIIFDPKFGRGGEDKDFFRRMIVKGKKFYWNAEVFVYESVPPERCKRMFMIKRALLRLCIIERIFYKTYYPIYSCISGLHISIACFSNRASYFYEIFSKIVRTFRKVNSLNWNRY